MKTRTTALHSHLPMRLPTQLSVLLALAGCAAQPASQAPAADGATVRAALARQALPAAPGQLSASITGVDGGAALAVQANYRKSYAAATAPAQPMIATGASR